MLGNSRVNYRLEISYFLPTNTLAKTPNPKIVKIAIKEIVELISNSRSNIAFKELIIILKPMKNNKTITDFSK